QAVQALQARITAERLQRHVGKTVPVLVEGEASRGEGRLCGRAPGNEMVNFGAAPGALPQATTGALPGAIVDVEITARRSHTLYGEARDVRLPSTIVTPILPRRLPVLA